jgi:hypothetical protein
MSTLDGLAAGKGLMTTEGGRSTVSYIVKCALAAGDTLVKQDQNGMNYTFKGSLGLAPQFKTAGCDQACSEAMSSCLMAHVNTSSVHIPLWMTSPMTQIGWGQSPYFPTQEGTFFGQLMVTNAANNLDAYYCNGSSVAQDTVPGRLGQQQGAPYANAYPTEGGTCAGANHCTMNADGAVSCMGNGKLWDKPITVWRGQIKQAEDFVTSNMWVNDSANSRGRRAGNIGPTAAVKFTGVHAGAAGTNNLVIYYANGDCPTGNLRYFNVKVNGGAAQNRSFASMTCGDWHKIGQAIITLSGFKAGNVNTVDFYADGQHAAPDLDWIEVVPAAGTASGQSPTTACAPGKTVGLKAIVSGKFASARQEDSGTVKALATSEGTWEQFEIVDAGGGLVGLKSKMNNLFVAAEAGTANVPLKARSATIGSWEKFKFELQSDGFYALKAMANNKYVSARVDQANSPLQAVAGTASSWEDFQCE